MTEKCVLFGMKKTLNGGFRFWILLAFLMVRTIMKRTVTTGNTFHIKQLLENALTDKINDREMFMKGIDYSYYYEEAE